MSKMDAQRAMREARYAQTATTSAPQRAAATPVAQRAVPTSAQEPTQKAAQKVTQKAAPTPAAAADGDLCGHRNMSGRTCTRVQGHSEKSHRYS